MPERCEQTERVPIAITGVAATASLGGDAESIWRAMLAGRCGMAPMTDIESALPPGSLGGQAADLPSSYCPGLPREARYLRWTIEHALADAGLSAAIGPASRRCAVLGTTLHGLRAGGRFLRSGKARDLGSFLASATARISLDGLGIEGGALTTCSACSSSLGAVALAATLLESGQADVVVAGGYDAISEYAWAGFNSLRLIAEGPLRPFCRGRQGMKVAEGYGIVILERACEAAERGARVRAVLAGWGETADSHHLTQPHPQGEGALAAMQQALRGAGVEAADLGLIAAHATGTPENDESEFRALSRLLGEDLPRVPVVGFKSFLGHTLGGAGAVELVMSCMALRDQRVPACPNVRAEEIEFPGLNVSSGGAADRPVPCTLNTSLGFGGANTCVVLTQAERHRKQSARAGSGLPAGRRACITGVGVVLPGAVGHAAFVNCCCRPPDSRAQRGQGISDEAMAEYLNVRRARRLSQYVKFSLAAAAMAVRDAGLGGDRERLASANAILGSMHGSASFCYEYYSEIVSQGVMAANPVLFAEGVPNAAAAHLSVSLGVRGACQTIIGSRTAGLDALALAALRVQNGTADTVLVVAAEAPCGVVDDAYREYGLHASDERVSNARHPGFFRSFGGVAFVVESSTAAAARGAMAYGAVLGSRWAMPRAGGGGGPAGAVASVLTRLKPVPGRVIGSASGTWVDRAEQLGLRRAGMKDSGSGSEVFGELFAVSPFVGIARELVGGSTGEVLASLCTDWSGAASAVGLERLERRLGGAETPVGRGV
ncbi:MAG: beta-ketoacyl-[acyl-carrier-protein] synthase family protein [Phycisphaeraceae bacterium]|nr:beta-ketoacyl-[acyl-carrier-protein] synthase family protein [Phycisphaeraceae bacterium]